MTAIENELPKAINDYFKDKDFAVPVNYPLTKSEVFLHRNDEQSKKIFLLGKDDKVYSLDFSEISKGVLLDNQENFICAHTKDSESKRGPPGHKMTKTNNEVKVEGPILNYKIIFTNEYRTVIKGDILRVPPEIYAQLESKTTRNSKIIQDDNTVVINSPPMISAGYIIVNKEELKTQIMQFSSNQKLDVSVIQRRSDTEAGLTKEQYKINQILGLVKETRPPSIMGKARGEIRAGLTRLDFPINKMSNAGNILAKEAIAIVQQSIKIPITAASPINSNEPNNGGIDFNPNRLNFRTQGNRVEMPAPSDYQNIEINGLVPFIFSITPVTSLPLLLGEREEEEEFEVLRNRQELPVLLAQGSSHIFFDFL